MKRTPVFDNDLNVETHDLNLNEKTLQQISVADLRIGMYVESLDKPWSDSEFVLQGFFIRSKQDIVDLRRECRFVHVDASVKPDTQRQQNKVHFPVFACGS